MADDNMSFRRLKAFDCMPAKDHFQFCKGCIVVRMPFAEEARHPLPSMVHILRNQGDWDRPWRQPQLDAQSSDMQHGVGHGVLILAGVVSGNEARKVFASHIHKDFMQQLIHMRM